MNITWLTFILIAALSFGATEVLKAIVNLFKPEWKLGLIFSVVFSLMFTVGLGVGFVGWLAGVDYSKAMVPTVLQVADILTTAFILSMGSKGLNSFVENNLGIDISGGLKNAVDKFLSEHDEP